ncbi:unnamed protein product, partial [Symbiodinium microadriaticum]
VFCFWFPAVLAIRDGSLSEMAKQSTQCRGEGYSCEGDGDCCSSVKGLRCLFRELITQESKGSSPALEQFDSATRNWQDKKKGICALSHVDNGVVVFQGKGDNCENDFDCDPFLSLTCKNSACVD